MTRKDGRAFDELRPIKVTTDFVKFAEGSCLIECGDTKVLCCCYLFCYKQIRRCKTKFRCCLLCRQLFSFVFICRSFIFFL